MWSLMAAPLFFSGDMTKLDAFTLNVLCNSEVIDIDQDSLGHQARIVRESPEELVLAKTLDDGSVAIGLFNLSDSPRAVTVAWNEVGLTGSQQVRDVWHQRTIGSAAGSYSSKINQHGVTFVRLIPSRAR
jgi:alpha-galactosidase